MRGHKVVTVERGDAYAARCEIQRDDVTYLCGITFGGFATRSEARAALAHEETPASAATDRGGMAPQEGTEMDNRNTTGLVGIVKSGPYAGYQVVVGDDYPTPVYYDEAVVNDQLIRVHYRVSRLPSTRTIKLRHLTGSTDQDRKIALDRIECLGTAFRRWEQQGAVTRVRLAADPRKWLFYALAGTKVSDPMVQLELEMMIDQVKARAVGDSGLVTL